jgi:hypothetical protein
VSIDSHCENKIVNQIKNHAIPLLKIVEHVTSDLNVMEWLCTYPFMLGAVGLDYGLAWHTTQHNAQVLDHSP